MSTTGWLISTSLGLADLHISTSWGLADLYIGHHKVFVYIIGLKVMSGFMANFVPNLFRIRSCIEILVQHVGKGDI
jgi:hypothetical protein